MKYISQTVVEQSFSQVLDTIEREPVVIYQQNQEVAVILSMKDYEKIIKANIQDFQQFCDIIGQQAQVKGLSEEKLYQILADE